MNTRSRLAVSLIVELLEFKNVKDCVCLTCVLLSFQLPSFIHRTIEFLRTLLSIDSTAYRQMIFLLIVSAEASHSALYWGGIFTLNGALVIALVAVLQGRRSR